MAAKAHTLIPSDPEKVMLLRRPAPSLLTCSTPFLRFGRIKIGGRGTVVKLATDNLAVFSPVALTPALKSELQTFGSGRVSYIAALDQEHHIFLDEWHKEWPDAVVIGPDTLPGLRDKQGYGKIPAEKWILSKKGEGVPKVSEEFDREFVWEYVPSHVNKELVFCHLPTKTLIEADLLFNLPATEQFSKSGVSPTSGVLTKIFNYLQNTRGNAIWQKRFLWHMASSSDRAGFNRSMSKIAGWDFDRIIPCHGDVIETGGKGIFEKVMAWHLEAARKGH
ncbi:hypothetical protein M433DRAFT_150545 [Acidomyces richmondensis BFW]|nr:MAG: hypothetical protein FE78DRAFT_83848 [Acidomyces sp. 'richmondensis']KYG48936.1 hypothetical protein M433DRAFT_150545 [Acidomyces richmondensis BFW]